MTTFNKKNDCAAPESYRSNTDGWFHDTDAGY
jgi:hypothetical protein